MYKNSDKKIVVANEIEEIEISVDQPRLIKINGVNNRMRKNEERHLKITQKNKMILL
jgi:hypothetical protein